MAKLLEMNGAEMAAALVSISGSVRRFMEDEEFRTAFKRATAEGVRRNATDMLEIYTDLVPLIFGEKHLRDTIGILATVEGTTVSKMLKMNGTELLKDAMDAWKEQIAPFFTQLGLTVGGKRSSRLPSIRN